MDWADILIKVVPGALSTAATFVVFSKLAVGKKAKEMELLDRISKEVAVYDAILKLKIATCDSGTLQDAAAKENAYNAAERLETALRRELALLNPKPKPDVEWLQTSSARQKFWPQKYDGSRRLTMHRKLSWWGYVALFWAVLLLYFLVGVVGFGFTIPIAHMLHLHLDIIQLLEIYLTLGVISILLIHTATLIRRKAYALSNTIEGRERVSH